MHAIHGSQKICKAHIRAYHCSCLVLVSKGTEAPLAKQPLSAGNQNDFCALLHWYWHEEMDSSDMAMVHLHRVLEVSECHAGTLRFCST